MSGGRKANGSQIVLLRLTRPGCRSEMVKRATLNLTVAFVLPAFPFVFKLTQSAFTAVPSLCDCHCHPSISTVNFVSELLKTRAERPYEIET